MDDIDIYFPEIDYHFPMVYVHGTGESGFLFGAVENVRIQVDSFFLSKFLVTQRLWTNIMGNNPSHFQGPDRPVDHVSFTDIIDEHGFLHKLNIACGEQYKIKFRLPAETEWEYASKGGVHWKDGFEFSGSHNLSDTGWYELNSGKYNDPAIIATLKNHQKGTETHDVGEKQGNQLGIFDMSGNVWEWCQDYFQRDLNQIPKDGTAYRQQTADRVLRGGCHHNAAIHCTVSKRYAIIPEAKDECIGFRIAASLKT